VLLGGGVFDEGSKGIFLNGRCCVEGLGEPFLKDVENGGDGVAVFWIGLGVTAKLPTEISEHHL